VGLEVVLVVKVLADDAVVVDLAVDGEGEGAIIVDKGLSTRVYSKSYQRMDLPM
jgi:hypothetical protein